MQASGELVSRVRDAYEKIKRRVGCILLAEESSV